MPQLLGERKELDFSEIIKRDRTLMLPFLISLTPEPCCFPLAHSPSYHPPCHKSKEAETDIKGHLQHNMLS